jgi:hypothetical protein
VGVPALQRLVVGAALTVLPLAEPHAPFVVATPDELDVVPDELEAVPELELVEPEVVPELVELEVEPDPLELVLTVPELPELVLTPELELVEPDTTPELDPLDDVLPELDPDELEPPPELVCPIC